MLCCHYASSTQVITAGFDHSVRLWDAKSGKEIRRFGGHTDAVTGVVVSASNMIFSSSLDGTVRIWSANADQEIGQLLGHTGPVNGVMIPHSPARDEFVITFSDDQTVRLWEPKSHRQFASLPLYAPVTAVAASPGGRFIAVGDKAGDLILWDAQD